MEGTLPMELKHLHYLKELHIDINPGLTGSIPSEYGFFPHMQKLALSYNSIGGKIPDSFSWLTKLEQLNLEVSRTYLSMSASIENSSHDNRCTLFPDEPTYL
jgi:hypothetical protein